MLEAIAIVVGAVVALGIGVAVVRWLTSPPDISAAMALSDREQDRQRRLTERYLCVKCRAEIAWMSVENDYNCATCGAVDVIRTSDGAVLSGDGRPGPPRVLTYDHEQMMANFGINEIQMGVADPHPWREIFERGMK